MSNNISITLTAVEWLEIRRLLVDGMVRAVESAEHWAGLGQDDLVNERIQESDFCGAIHRKIRDTMDAQA